MLKWIASGCLVIIVVIGVVAYLGYRQLKTVAAAGPSVSVGIHAPATRVFASMSHTDSLPAWFAPNASIRTPKRGALALGDTLYLVGRRDSVPRMAWVVDTIVPNAILAMRWIALPSGMMLTRRRDSLSVSGDSTFVTSTVSSFLSDSLSAAKSRSGGVGGGMIDMTSTMGIAGARMQAEAEYKRLKTHIEGGPVSRP
jgi:uncharacterized protein YndB with AHSA1/START domain